MPSQAGAIYTIGKLFYHFFSRIPEIKKENYWVQLELLNLFSQQRRMERYRIIYIWKIIEGKAPNCGIEIPAEDKRHGQKVKVPALLEIEDRSSNDFEKTVSKSMQHDFSILYQSK